MSSGSNHEPVAGEALSALADGEADATLAQRVCAAWRDDRAARSTWHVYQLIGDVLRSEDLASPAGRDAAFLGQLRSRLAQEPVVLAPKPLESGAIEVESGRLSQLRRRRTWMASTAVAAGFVAVAGVVVVLRAPPQDAAAPVLASRDASPASAPVAALAASPAPQVLAEAAEPELQRVDRGMLRDSRLDRYLAAHKQFAGSSALGVPSQFLRSATVDASGR